MTPATLRPMRHEDSGIVQAFHEEQVERDGTTYPLPPLLQGKTVPAVPVALMVEAEDGELLGALYVDTAPELCFAGCDPRATAVARRDIEALAWTLRQMGFQHLRCLVPRVALEGVRRPLVRAGFKEREDLVVFSRSLAATADGEPAEDAPEREGEA